MTERIVAGGFTHAFNHASMPIDKAARFMDRGDLQRVGARKSTIPQVRQSHFPFSLSSSGCSFKKLATPFSMSARRAVKLRVIFMRQSFSTRSGSGELVDPYPITSLLSLSRTCMPIEWNGEYFAPAPSTTEDPVWSTAFRSWQKSDAVKLSSRRQPQGC